MNSPKRIFSILLLVLLAATVSWFYSQEGQQSPSATESATAQPQASTQISYLDIVNHPEFRQGYKLAMQQHDALEMTRLQQKALEIAQAAGLPTEEMMLLEGERGQHYLQFRAARQLFNEQFVTRFNRLQNIEGLKQAYPQAQDLFAKADALIAQRDASIVQIARELAGPAQDLGPYLEQAKAQWLAKTSAQAAPASQ